MQPLNSEPGDLGLRGDDDPPGARVHLQENASHFARPQATSELTTQNSKLHKPGRGRFLAAALVLAIPVALGLYLLTGSRPGAPTARVPATPTVAAQSSSPAESSAAETATPLPVAARVGAMAPDFTFGDVFSDTEVTLSSLRGHPVWLNFWATWCTPCMEEMPDIQATYDKYKDRGLRVLGLNQADGTDRVRNLAQSRHYTWTFVVDWDSAVAHQYAVTGIPGHVFVDKDGVIRSMTYGQLTPRAMEEGIQSATGD